MANYLERIWPDFKELARSKRKENKKFFTRLHGQDPKRLNEQFHAMHEEVFAETDCLTCARCCRTTGPLLTKQDIGRISKKQGMKAADFEKQYLRVDEDGDWVMKSLPCPFLELDTNKCTIYEYAPKACRQYPHTNHPNMKSILGLTETNVRHCPAVFEMVERMKQRAQF
ncbi:YkgJ family cysteine cluster protein [Schleiferiaceae bacterium]|nr:YkgJ family cysteine cluster protein [Schleiferiaceae bacterium]